VALGDGAEVEVGLGENFGRKKGGKGEKGEKSMKSEKGLKGLKADERAASRSGGQNEKERP
jgi:hypothetical protein